MSTCWPTRASIWANRSPGQLRGKLRELRFYLGRTQTRISYYIATGRRIILLTVFSKSRPREHREIDRAWKAMQTCVSEGHVAEEEE